MSALPHYRGKYLTIAFGQREGVLQITLHKDGGEFVVSEPALRDLGKAFVDVAWEARQHDGPRTHRRRCAAPGPCSLTLSDWRRLINEQLHTGLTHEAFAGTYGGALPTPEPPVRDLNPL